MSVPAPHFLLYPQAVPAAGGTTAADRTPVAIGENLPRGREPSRWRFVLRQPNGRTSLEATDAEAGAGAERLELLAIVRGLEALDQPSRVTLVTSTPIERGLKYGLAQWRESGWHWERYGKMSPVKNRDLWQRLDRLLAIHTVECRPQRLEKADDLAVPPRTVSRGQRRLRIDPAVKFEARNSKPETNSKASNSKNRNRPSFDISEIRAWNLSRISCFVLRAWHRLCLPLRSR